MAENDAARLQQELIEAEMERKAEELRMLCEMRQEAGFTPRQSLARTPPQGFSTPLGEPRPESPMEAEEGAAMPGEKRRYLTSPEEVQGALRRCLGMRKGRVEVPPIGGLLSRPVPAPPSPPPPPAAGTDRAQPDSDLSAAPVDVLAGLASASTKGIMEAVKAKTSKLNKDEIAAIGVHTERLSAVIMHLSLRVAAAENRAALAERDVKSGVAAPAPHGVAIEGQPPKTKSFANALRLGKGQEPVPIARPPGPSVVIYPAEDQKEALKTAEDTRRVLLGAVRPGQLGLQIAGVRKVGNAGVVVQTTSVAAANTLKKAVPPTLRTVEPTERWPLIALTGIDRDTSLETVLTDLKEQNLQEDETWTRERLERELRLIFKRNRHGNRTRWVCQASRDLRQTLITKGRIYLGWDVVEVTDHVSVTCCNRCQLFGHPEKYCRAKTMVCGNCGEEGHRNAECQAANPTCATCKRFGRKGAQTHRTASRDCPARAHAEQSAGSAVATAELPRIAEEERLDVILVQEPYTAHQELSIGGPLLILPEGPNPKAGVFLARTDMACAVLRHLTNAHCIVCHITWGKSSLHIVSAYFQYSEDIAVHLEHCRRVMGDLRGRRVLLGADVNAHSPLWHSAPRHYVGRGREVASRREQMEGFILAHDLVIHNAPGQPYTFGTINGESNIDVTVTTRGVDVSEWRVHEHASSSDHRLITLRLCGTRARGLTLTAEPSVVPKRFRERGVDWDRFQARIHERVGTIDWSRPAGDVCKEFTRIIAWTADECLGTCGDRKKGKGYEWWSPALESLRKRNNRLRKAWQDVRKVGGDREASARNAFHVCRSSYRAAMEKAQLDFFRKLADTGNQDPWGLAYRAASGRFRPPPNVVNGTKLAEGFAVDVGGAMRGLVGALCPDDDPSRDTAYHRQVRLAAACIPSGQDAPPLSCQDLEKIVKDLPNTAPGIDGITAGIVRRVWRVASAELTHMFGMCVAEGVFPDTWKDGRLIVLPKGGDKPLTDPKAYRPITLLPVLGKILERILLLCAPAIMSGVSSAQHGFSRGKSTLTALNSIVDTVQSSRSRYVQAIFLDISGAFDNAWWPMILLKAKRGGCPPNIYRMLAAYFTNRRVGLFAGSRIVWKVSTMGCPQGSVVGPPLWNLLLDDLLRLPFPVGVRVIAYADDLTVLIESDSRAGIEASASCAMALITEWGDRNRLGFSPSKSYSMTLKGGLAKRPPTVRLGGASVKSVRSTRVLGVVIDANLSFGEHAQSIGERAAAGLGKMSRVSASSWGIRYRALKVLYKGIFVATITYAAGCWWRRVNTHMVRAVLQRTQRPALILVTKAYRSVSTAALPVLAGVLPADLEVARAGNIDDIRGLPRDAFRAGRRVIASEAVAKWQQRWEKEDRGRELYRFFPDVAVRLGATWVEPDYQVSQILTGHGCFRKRLYDMKLCEVSVCYCGEEDECLDHVLWRCPLYEDQRRKMMDGITRLEEGPVYYCDLVASEANFRQLKAFAYSWHRARSELEREDGPGSGSELASLSVAYENP